MQMRDGSFLPRTHYLRCVICNDSQTLVTGNNSANIYLDIIQMPVFCGPAIPVINDHVAAGFRGNGSCGRCCHPKIRCVFTVHHIVVWSKIYCTPHLIIMRAGWRSPDPIIKPIKSHPGKSLLPGPLEHIHWRRCRVMEALWQYQYLQQEPVMPKVQLSKTVDYVLLIS